MAKLNLKKVLEAGGIEGPSFGRARSASRGQLSEIAELRKYGPRPRGAAWSWGSEVATDGPPPPVDLELLGFVWAGDCR